MNREQVLNELVETLGHWPDILSECPYHFDGWVWEMNRTDLRCVHLWYGSITEQDWLDELKNQRRTKATIKPSTAPNDQVHQPKHYGVLDGVESIQIIASSMTRDEWRGFCMGNIMKYRMRAGKKDALQQDIDKANEYEMLFEKYKELNRAKR